MKDLRCPLCQQPLLQNDAGLACQNRHHFDRAKEGYFNLLPVQYKHSREPGDSSEQLQARRHFLAAGFYDGLKSRLLELLPAETQTVLDIGCGEGYFTAAVAAALPRADVYGLDIAKAGVRLAAKAAKHKTNLIYCVGSSFDLPLANQSIDTVTRIFAPSQDAELYRVIKPAGRLIVVTPGLNHLIHLRSRIYQAVRPHPELITPVGFIPLSQHHLHSQVSIDDHAMRAALLMMTPFAWRMSPELRDAILAGTLHDQFHFTINLYRKS